MRGVFGQGALMRGRARHSTCLSGKARRRQAAQQAAGPNELAEALEANARHLFAGLTPGDVIQVLRTPRSQLALGFPSLRSSPFRARLRTELLGDRSGAGANEWNGARSTQAKRRV
jgi:hypothetical protein